MSNDPDQKAETRLEFTQDTECVDPFVFTVDRSGCFTISETDSFSGDVIEAFHGCDLDAMIAMLTELRDKRSARWSKFAKPAS